MATPPSEEDFAEEHLTTLLTLFEAAPGQFAWRYPIYNEIESRRAHMDGQLIFDLLLSAGDISIPSTLYPPQDIEGLKDLLITIQNCNFDSLKKDCLIYYLVKWHRDGREDLFSGDNCIPPQFVLLADAYWCLDSGIDVAKAVSYLSDIRLNRDFPSKTLQAISLSPDANALILKYIRTAKPILTEPIDIDLYTIALAESSLIEAWQYQRTYSEVSGTKERLVRKIFEWCLTPNPRPAPLAQLLALPFSSSEQALIDKYALNPPSSIPTSSIPVLQDLVCVRLIQSGAYTEAIKLDRRFAGSIIPGTTTKMQKAIGERKKMVDELLAALPSVERKLLEAELEVEALGISAAPKPTPSAKSRGRPSDIGMSWEELRAPSGSASAGGSRSPPKATGAPVAHAIPMSARTGNDMPRFGLGGSNALSRSLSRTSLNGNSSLNGKSGGATSSTPFSISMSAPSLARPAQNSQAIPLSSSQSSRAPLAPLLGSSGAKFPTPLFNQSASNLRTGLGPGATTASSLFSKGGSANQTRNAFYTPPPNTASGLKRPLVEDGSANPAGTPPVPIFNAGAYANGDITMDADTDDEYMPQADDGNVTAEDAPAEMSHSVFGNSSAAASQPPLKSRRISRAVSEMKMPPGAYVPDDEEVAAAAALSNERHTSPSPPPEAALTLPAPAAKPAGRQARQANTRAKKLASEPDLKRSLPGSFMSEEENEEEDHVGPLPGSPPPSKRTARPRKTRSIGPEDGDLRPTRRSSRLSTASSVTSASPEPEASSATKTSSKSRKSTKGAGSKSGSRKK